MSFVEVDMKKKKQFKITLTDEEVKKADEISNHLTELVDKTIEVKYEVNYEKEEFKALQEIIKNQKIAIENLIRRNKELEERDRANRRVIREYNDYIPKSKVREKIEEYKWASEGYDSDTADYGQSQAIGAYIALIKLLQEGDK